MSYEQRSGKRTVWSIVVALAVWTATVSREAIAAADPLSGRGESPALVQSSGDLDGGATGPVDPVIERRSRGVARQLLVAGIAVAAVIALLSGVFAFRHKRQ